jgi:hypothetical protein
MADLRLMAKLAAVATASAAITAVGAGAGCRRAGAAPDQASGLMPPAGWQALPPIAAAARAALGRGATVDGAEAWGEPAMGCYAVWLAIRAAGSAEAIGQQVVAGFTAAAAGSGGSAGAKPAGSAAPEPGSQTIVKDVAAPTGEEGVLTLAFERGDHRGRLRARLGGGRITALACFANQREPLACEAACTTFLGALP